MTAFDLFCVAGQSNAEGRGSSTTSPVPDNGSLEGSGNGSVLVALEDPVGGASTGSAWPSFAIAYDPAGPVVITESAFSGTPLMAEHATSTTGWHPAGFLLGNSVSRTNRTRAALITAGHTPTFRGVLWCQGETDAVRSVDMATFTPVELQDAYLAALLGLHDRYIDAFVDPDLKLYVFRTGTQPGYEAAYTAVRNAQDEAAATRSNIVVVYRRSVDFPSLGWMKADNLHYNQDGLNDMGALGGAAVGRDIYGDVLFPEPPPDPDPPDPPGPTSLRVRLDGVTYGARARLNGEDREAFGYRQNGVTIPVVAS